VGSVHETKLGAIVKDEVLGQAQSTFATRRHLEVVDSNIL
jgi:hypothetical protein